MMPGNKQMKEGMHTGIPAQAAAKDDDV